MGAAIKRGDGKGETDVDHHMSPHDERWALVRDPMAWPVIQVLQQQFENFNPELSFTNAPEITANEIAVKFALQVRRSVLQALDQFSLVKKSYTHFSRGMLHHLETWPSGNVPAASPETLKATADFKVQNKCNERAHLAL